MKKLLLIISITILFTSFTHNYEYEECDIVGFYSVVDTEYGTKAIDAYGDIVEIKQVLVRINDLKEGKFTATVTRVDDNMYEVIGTEIYIETSLCLELAVYDEVIIEITKHKGYNFGTIYFKQ